MATFGVTTEPRPKRVDDLIDSDLMAKLDQVDIVSRKIFAGKLQGERRSKRRGISVEFADYRHYTHGDDLRFVDWNIYARLDSFHLKLFQEQEDLTLHLLIDASRSSAHTPRAPPPITRRAASIVISSPHTSSSTGRPTTSSPPPARTDRARSSPAPSSS